MRKLQRAEAGAVDHVVCCQLPLASSHLEVPSPPSPSPSPSLPLSCGCIQPLHSLDLAAVHDIHTHAGISQATLKDWSIDPLVGGKSLFDQLEDLDVEDCVAKAKVLNAKK